MTMTEEDAADGGEKKERSLLCFARLVGDDEGLAGLFEGDMRRVTGRSPGEEEEAKDREHRKPEVAG